MAEVWSCSVLDLSTAVAPFDLLTINEARGVYSCVSAPDDQRLKLAAADSGADTDSREPTHILRELTVYSPTPERAFCQTISCKNRQLRAGVWELTQLNHDYSFLKRAGFFAGVAAEH